MEKLHNQGVNLKSKSHPVWMAFAFIG